MTSSLASQLAASTSLNSALLTSRSKHHQSYLFTGPDASEHDLQSIHAIAHNSFIALTSLNPRFSKYEAPLFGYAARETDRTLLSKDSVKELDKHLDGFLTQLGPYLLSAPAGKTLEWLVRRFRINDFNVDQVLRVFLPYHESPHFTKMLSILTISPNSPWSFLLPYQKAAKALPRHALVTEMLKNSGIARSVTGVLPKTIHGGGSTHPCLLTFNAATLHEFILRSDENVLDEGTLAYLIPSLLEPLKIRDAESKEGILASFILLSALSHKTQFTTPTLINILTNMTNSARHVQLKHYLNAVLTLCEPQEECDRTEFSDKVARTFAKISGINEELKEWSKFGGFERFIHMLLPELVKRDDEKATELINTLITDPDTPKSLIKRLAILLLPQVISHGDLESQRSRTLLSAIHQRQPAALSDAIDDISLENPDLKEEAETVLVQLATGTTASADPILAATNAEAKVRAKGVRDLIKSLPTSEEDTESLRSTILSMVGDPEPQVVDALYSNPDALAALLLPSSKEYIGALATLLSSGSKMKKHALKQHLVFLLKHLLPTTSSSSDMVFRQIVIPLILFTKPRKHSTELVWEALAQHPNDFELLRGCVDIWNKKSQSEQRSDEEMIAMNSDIAQRIAGMSFTFPFDNLLISATENIIKSNGFVEHLEWLLSSLDEQESTSKRLLTSLISRFLLARLEGEKQIQVGLRILESLDLGLLAGAALHENWRNATQNLDESIFTKPNSQNTVTLLSLDLVLRVSSLPRPAIEILHWLGSPDTAYAVALRKLYAFACSCTSCSGLTLAILEKVFTALSDDSLLFLGHFWIPEGNADWLVIRALQHAAAFIESQASAAVDLQTILPSLLTCLTSANLDIRKYALECVQILHGQAKSPSSFRVVYKFDAVYPVSSSALQYLSQEDLARYLRDLVEETQSFLTDPNYLETFHSQYVGKKKGLDRKKDAEYKSHVLCYLLSHIASHPSRTAKLCLLTSLNKIRDSLKAKVLLPAIRDLLSEDDLPQSELSTLLLSTLDSTVAKDLNSEAETGMWETYTLALRYVFKHPASGSTSTREVFLETLKHDVFGLVSKEEKIEICWCIIEMGSRDSDEHDRCEDLLRFLLSKADGDVLLRLLQNLQTDLEEGEERANKKAKTVGTQDDNPLSRLSLFAQVLASSAFSLPPSLELLTRLLDILGSVVHQASKGEAAFVEQLLMESVEGVASSLIEVPSIQTPAPTAIRIDLLVSLLRTTSNPQTLHLALSLISTLAKLSPESLSVLHNVMPIFTFMGGNVFHRDDEAGVSVVRKTVESIVPAMISSLRAQDPSGGKMELFKASKEFLRVFTDAAGHIPRHRRTSFFTHLIDTLGPQDFLVPICLLLIQKVSNNRAIRQQGDVKNLLGLPVAIIAHYSNSLQNTAMNELLVECQQLVRKMLSPDDVLPIYLDDLLHESEQAPLEVFKRRAQAVIAFVGLAAATSPAVASSDTIIQPLILLSSGDKNKDKEDVSRTARAALNQILNVVSVADFIKAVRQMLSSGDPKVQHGALTLLHTRLAKVSSQARENITADVCEIVESIHGLLKSSPDDELAQDAFKALASISDTLQLGEENAITRILPTVLKAVQNRKRQAIRAVAVLPDKLGPRILPFFRDIVSLAVAILEESDSDSLLQDASGALLGLLHSIPAFWSSQELTLVLKFCFNSSDKASKTGLGKAIAKRIPPKTLLPTMCEMASTVTQLDRQIGFFAVLRRSLRLATKADIEEHLRPLFQVFLGAFEVYAQHVDLSQEEAISAFVEFVVKLNEITFKPLFRRLYDWAFVAKGAVEPRRRVIFCEVFIALMDYFKDLITPYTSFTLQAFIDSLNGFSSPSGEDDSEYWQSIVQTLSKSLVHDDGTFWRTDKLAQIVPVLVAQVPVAVRLNHDAEHVLKECLTTLVDCLTDDDLVKAINLGLLMHTRSDDVGEQLLALACSESAWTASGGKLRGFAAETAPFIAECIEDTNDLVAKQAFKLKEAVEAVAGNIGIS